MQVYKIDERGYYIEPVIIEKNTEVPTDSVEIQPPQGLYRAKWTGIEWIEDMTQEEIDDLNNQPSEPTTEERLKLAEDTILFMLMGGM